VLSLSHWIDDESRPLPRTQVATKRVKGRATRTATRKAPPARKVARRQATLS
jgi:hypothetical protein